MVCFALDPLLFCLAHYDRLLLGGVGISLPLATVLRDKRVTPEAADDAGFPSIESIRTGRLPVLLRTMDGSSTGSQLDLVRAASIAIAVACHGIASHSHSRLASAQQYRITLTYSTRMQAFLFDTTGSMGSYIASATANIEKICDAIVSSNKLPSSDSLRLAVIAYRDHPPQDVSYVTKTLPFTSDVGSMKEFLKNLYASGGGDGPEAVVASMMESLDLDWRPNASRMVVSSPIPVWWQKQLTVPADSHCRRGRPSKGLSISLSNVLILGVQPPHGIGEYGDGFPNGYPGGMLDQDI